MSGRDAIFGRECQTGMVLQHGQRVKECGVDHFRVNMVDVVGK